MIGIADEAFSNENLRTRRLSRWDDNLNTDEYLNKSSASYRAPKAAGLGQEKGVGPLGAIALTARPHMLHDNACRKGGGSGHVPMNPYACRLASPPCSGGNEPRVSHDGHSGGQSDNSPGADSRVRSGNDTALSTARDWTMSRAIDHPSQE